MYTDSYKLLAETMKNAFAPIAALQMEITKTCLNKFTYKIKEIYDITIPVYLSEHFKESASQISDLCKTALLNIELPNIPSNAFDILNNIDLDNDDIEIDDENIGQFSHIIDNGTIAMKALGEANVEQNKTNSIDLPESLAELISSIDSSLELPESDSKNIIHVKESSNSNTFCAVLSVLIAIIGLFTTFYMSYSSSVSSSKQHSELMQEERKQTEQLRQLNKTMEQLHEAISHNLENNDTDDKSSTITQSQ